VIAAWMLYATALGCLLAGAAVALERLAGWWRLPRRWAWLVAVALTIAAPAVLAVRRTAPPPAPPSGAAAPALPPGFGGVGMARPLTMSARILDALRAAGAHLDRPLALAWLLGSAALAFGLADPSVRQRRSRRTWARRLVGGTPVLVAGDAGPAVLGVWRLEVVLPAWALTRPEAEQRMILAHEEAHRRARDPNLLLLGAVALVLTPWNAALWWQIRRLRLAMETDCDDRVLRSGTDRHAYGSLLLSVAERLELQPVLAVARFAESRSALERRIDAMTALKPRHPVAWSLAAVAAASVLVAGACEMSRPSSLRSSADTASAAFRPEQGAHAAAGVIAQVRRDLSRDLVARYPALRTLPAGSTVNLWYELSVTGAVVASGRWPNSAGLTHFSPPGNQGSGVFVLEPGEVAPPRIHVSWARMPVVVTEGRLQQPVYTERQVDERPEYVTGPRPRYPEVLRLAGINGRALAEFVVDTTGRPIPASFRIIESTDSVFEGPTREAILGSTFHPGRVAGKAVLVLVRQPVNYQVASSAPARP
jgi:hypothetical protein